MLRDTAREAAYLTLDFWNSRKAYEQFMEARAADYERLDAASEELLLWERRMGWFEGVNEIREQRSENR